jgi:hypothetical protein
MQFHRTVGDVRVTGVISTGAGEVGGDGRGREAVGLVGYLIEVKDMVFAC